MYFMFCKVSNFNVKKYNGISKWLMKMTGLYEFLPSNELMQFLGQTLCHQNSSMNIICDNILFLLAGYDADQLDQVRKGNINIICIVFFMNLI